jgi:hypothetical protein
LNAIHAVTAEQRIGEIVAWDMVRGYTFIHSSGPAPNEFYGHIRNFEGITDESQIRSQRPVTFTYYPADVVEATRRPKAFYIRLLPEAC